MRHGELIELEADKPREECGVFGVCFNEGAAVAAYYGLVSLQHRGQELSLIHISTTLLLSNLTREPLLV